MDSFTSRVETSTKAISFKTRKKATVKCSGLMEASIKDNGRMEHSMAKAKFT